MTAIDHAHMAPLVAEIIREPVVAHTFGDRGTHFRAENGNGFYLFATSRASPEHIAHGLKGPQHG